MGSPEITKTEIYKLIFTDYILKIPRLRLLAFPLVMLTIFTKFLEVYQVNIVDDISSSYKQGTLRNGQIFYFIFIHLFCSFSTEITGLIASRPIQRTERVGWRVALRYCLRRDYKAFHAMNAGDTQMYVRRSGKAVLDLIDCILLNIIPLVAIIVFSIFFSIVNFGAVVGMAYLLMFLTYFYVTIFATKRYRWNYQNNASMLENDLFAQTNDLISNYETLASSEPHILEGEIKRIDNILQIYEDNSTRLWCSYHILNFIQAGIFVFFMAAAIFLRINKMSSESFAVFLFLNTLIQSYLSELTTIYNRFACAFVNIKISFAVQGILNKRAKRKRSGDSIGDGNRHIHDICTDNEYIDGQIKRANPPCAGTLNKSLELKGVSIYHKERKILSNISFRINRGDKVAIIGKNGAGKSTIVKAIMGFVDYEGVIRIDDLDVVGSCRKIPNESCDSGGGSFQVKEILENSTPDEVVLDVSKTPFDKREASSISKVSKIKHSSLRNLISYGSQKGCIWDNTVMYNLKYGNTKKESEILRVCKLFRFHDDFIRLPYGYFTRTGEMGKLLSGGEIQKIILVRSFVNDLPVVILDEPFSNLDDKSTKNAINAIFREFTDKTVIIVIHDLEYLHLFGKVLVVEDGQVSVRENMN